VALVALRALLSFVFIVFLVAAVTVERGVFISIFCVTLFARHFTVFPAKRILRLVVIKTDLFPIVVGVAISAGLPHSPLMFVVFLVTGIAGGRGLAVFDLGFVTGFAFHFLGVRVRAAKREISF
jgi:hypothetical protein